MNKKLLVIPALLIAIGGGAALAQTNLFVNAEENPTITASKAKEIALKEVKGNIVSFEYDGDDRTPNYEIDVVEGNEKVEIKINAATGESKITERKTIQKKNETSTQQNNAITTQKDFISPEKAVEIATSKANGQVVKVELDDDDHIVHYEVEIRNGKTEYEFKIDAVTGDILKYEEDLED